MYKVSVIIPIFKVEAYLRECLNCIVCQTLKDIQIICVDDSTPDNSLEIVKEYKSKDERIVIIKHDFNMGLSAARNTGLLYAEGEFVYFMDGDDLLELDALEICFEQCKKNQLDVLTFDADVFLDGSLAENKFIQLMDFDYDRKKILEPNKVFSGKDFFYIASERNAFKSAVWLNFIKTDLLKSNKLFFYPGIIYEDQIFTIQLYFLSERIMYYPEKFFKRRLRDNSIMTNKIGYKNIHDILVVSEELIKLSKNENSKKFKRKLIQYVFSLLKWMEQLKNKVTNKNELERIEIELDKNTIWKKYLFFKNMNLINVKVKAFIKIFIMHWGLFAV
jgi:glycosyltransferase involved in cell wall biosynthesis